MDPTLNSRQKSIINALKSNGKLSRAEITNLLSKTKKVSRPTVIRDLNELLALKIVKTEGGGRATVYRLSQENSLLQYFDVDDYFSRGLYDRSAMKNFNPGVFDSLASLYNKSEIALWEKSVKEFSKRSQKLDPTIYKRELERFIIELSWKSSQIEGNTYTLLETETLIKQRIRAKGHAEGEAIMILNHKYAFDEMLNNKERYKKLTLSKVSDLHSILVRGLGVSEGIRKERVGITGTIYKPIADSTKLHKKLLELIDHVNSVDYPPEKALIIAAMVAYLQPFADGNKRTSRMLANAILLAYGYYPLSYRDVDVNEYKKTMLLFYEQNNLYHLKRIFIEQLQFAMDNYFRV
ncbi:Fic family protein [Patescibacteria group bacterium]